MADRQSKVAERKKRRKTGFFLLKEKKRKKPVPFLPFLLFQKKRRKGRKGAKLFFLETLCNQTFGKHSKIRESKSPYRVLEKMAYNL